MAADLRATLLVPPLDRFVIAVAHAHAPAGSAAQGPDEWLLLLALALAGSWYAAGFVRVWRGASAGRRTQLRRALLFGAGWLTIVISLVSPLHSLGLRSFTAHMIEHELLMLVAAPLFAFSRPFGVLVWALPAGARRAVAWLANRPAYRGAWSRVSTPLAASLLQAALLWTWHAPQLFDRALTSEGWHVAQHLSFVLSAVLFWWAVDRASTREGHHGVAGFYLFFTALQSGMLGALMAFSASPWYGQYVALGLAGAGPLDPLEDQQFAGLVMWIPGGTVHALAALFYLRRWFSGTSARRSSPTRGWASGRVTGQAGRRTVGS